MNETEAQRIATAINALRPDWPTGSLTTLLASPQLAGRPRRDVAVALAWVACESETKTPARVLEAGPWWKAVTIESPITRQPPRRDQACRRHPGEWPDHCRGCAGDRLAGDETATFNPRRTEAGERVDGLRQLVKTAQAGLCACGVAPRLCADHDPRRQSEPSEESSDE